MTTTRQHIEDLDVEAWAALTRRAAADAVAAAERGGTKAPEELVRVAAMSERQLVEHRRRNGPARKSLSAVMQLVEADHLRRVAEHDAENAEQGKRDAESATVMARAEAEESARAATVARDEAREVRAQAAQKEVERAAERAAHEQALRQARSELAQVRADTAAEIATAREHVAAAEQRAEQRATERTADRGAHEQALQHVRNELKQVRADADAEIAVAREQVIAAQARAEQRTTERADERGAHEQALQHVRGELAQVRADAGAEVAAVRGWAAADVARVREAADAEVARAHAAAEEAIGRAQAAEVRAASPRLLTIPVPPLGIRSQTRHIENALNALQQIDHVLEVGMADYGGSDVELDVEVMRSLVWIVQEHAVFLSNESREEPESFMGDEAAEAATGYTAAAADAFRRFLWRIRIVSERLRSRDRELDVEIVDVVTAMLADPWVAHMLSREDGP
jgi:colicin import membrane protein